MLADGVLYGLWMLGRWSRSREVYIVDERQATGLSMLLHDGLQERECSSRKVMIVVEQASGIIKRQCSWIQETGLPRVVD